MPLKTSRLTHIRYTHTHCHGGSVFSPVRHSVAVSICVWTLLILGDSGLITLSQCTHRECLQLPHYQLALSCIPSHCERRLQALLLFIQIWGSFIFVLLVRVLSSFGHLKRLHTECERCTGKRERERKRGHTTDNLWKQSLAGNLRRI